MHSAPGEYHGFFWFYFINEHLLRFLNLRYPRDYNTVPRLYSGCSICCGCFPGASIFRPSRSCHFKPLDRGGRDAPARPVLDRLHPGVLHVLHHAGILFDALLSGACAAAGLRDGCGRQLDHAWHARALWHLRSCAAAAVITCLRCPHNLPTPGDISAALSAHPGAYTLSLGHMEDLTIASFAYLRLPLLLAAVAFLVGAVGTFRFAGRSAFLAIALMMVLFFQAARIALAVFDPYLSSRPLAEALRRASRRQADRRSPLLHVLFDLLLYKSHGAAAERPVQQSCIRILCAGRARCVYR